MNTTRVCPNCNRKNTLRELPTIPAKTVCSVCGYCIELQRCVSGGMETRSDKDRYPSPNKYF